MTTPPLWWRRGGVVGDRRDRCGTVPAEALQAEVDAYIAECTTVRGATDDQAREPQWRTHQPGNEPASPVS